MTTLATPESRPRTTGRLLDRRPVISWAALALVAYVASVATVRFFDYLVVRAQTAQLVTETGPLSPVACQGCPGTPGLVLAWLTDWRALLVWGLIAASAVVAVRISRQDRPA